jgi:hypothetical protein
MNSSNCPKNFDTLPLCPIKHTYLRPDKGMSIVPWLISLLLLLVHLPLATIRIQRWEKAQIISVVLAGVSCIVVTMAYRSSKLTAETIYVWSPVILIGDVGAVLQVLALVAEKRRGMRVFSDCWGLIWRRRKRSQGTQQMAMRQIDRSRHHGVTRRTATDLEANELLARVESRGISSEYSASNIALLTIINILCWLFLAYLLTLQLIGAIVSAIQWHKNIAPGVPPIQESWCSPGFQMGTIANIPFQSEVGTECRNFTVTLNNQGTACIPVDGAQLNLLKGTLFILLAAFFCQLIDGVLLIRGYNRYKRRNVPYLSLGAGLLIWIFYVYWGFREADRYHLPSHDVVMMGLATGTCRTVLEAGGLRGEIIAWSDGVLNGNSSNVWYLGPSGL